MDDYISNKKNIYFVDGLEKFCRQRWRATQDLKAEAEERWNLQEKLHLQDREEIDLIATHPREIVPQAKGRSCRHRWREKCIHVNHDSRYATWFMLNTFYLIIASEGRSQGRMKQRRHKSCCIHQDQESTPACVDKKMTKPKNKSISKPRMV
jgi:hypothetical protein